ncbi:MAG: 2-iminoacetate synthase ThiH, partial [Candidatus Methanomethylophilaceae archaeon]|nr:2-iminoacetate synthase ThiH [Candidatus Methanomethylophilaceae archaeon]
MTRYPTDAVDYFPEMEDIGCDTMDEVLSRASTIDFDSYTKSDVRRAIDSCDTPEGFAALLSPAASGMMEEMASAARETTRRHFGNSVCLFTPLYLSNYCENGCVYCGFNSCNRINRVKLDRDMVAAELDSIASTGLQDILLLTGESRAKTGTDYISMCVEMAAERFSTVGLEVYPMNSDEYRTMRDAGADYVTVFQETYDPARYAELHPFGHKRVFSYRFNAQERALKGGMRGVAFGALLGLSDFRYDALRCGMHAAEIQRRYPHAEISMSLPRMRPFINGDDTYRTVTESQLLQVSLAYRLYLPYAGQTISTRETQRFRDGIVGISATRISAGVSVGIGEHSGEAH